ncbi:hypothetical protein [Bacillus sp. m3-13]|uniref:hypothetical protein n=1 Tax=Bacillus sp. m3-13 TaxID=406124 RepID=UPI0001E88FFC|nr:hypothetical protein [Bacillus sp. m3-13]
MLALLLSFVFLGSPWGIWTNKQAFEVYLEEKYEEDFVIEEISFDFFNTRKYHAYAYAADKPDLVFYVGQNRYTSKTEDGYRFEVWSFEAKEEVGQIVEEYFPDHSNYGVNLIFPETEPKEFILADYKKHATVEVGVSLDNIRVNSANSETEIERAFFLLQEIKAKEIQLQHFGISYQNRTLQLQKEDIQSINSVEEMEKFLREYNR